MGAIAIPSDVSTWLRSVFRECNEQITEKLCNNPNIQEEWLDYAWIEYLTRVSSPIRLGSEWTVKLRVHYLGGLRHYGTWEIADIGLLLFFRVGGRVVQSKVALLQSKRLYPSNMAVVEETWTDYEIGLARLADPEDLAHSIALDAVFDFDEYCRYGQLVAGSEQVAAISAYERHVGLPVHYQFYNPWKLPFQTRVPVAEFSRPAGELELGVRIARTSDVHSALAEHNDGYRLSNHDLFVAAGPGWPLEDFMADEFLECREGAQFDSPSDSRIETLFNRRSGPIAAAISLTLEAPENWEG